MNVDPWREAVALEGTAVRLVPLSRDHVSDLVATCSDPEVLRWVIPHVVADAEGFGLAIDQALAEQARGLRIPFAQVRRSDDVAIGSTSYLDVVPEHGRVEIGATFLARDAWRTAANTESKLLMLTHAFDTLGCERVALKTDILNGAPSAPSNASAAFARASCAITCGVPMGRGATPSTTRFCAMNGRRPANASWRRSNAGDPHSSPADP